ncbi:hypothetical protein, partial [Salinispira pacifica]
MGFKGIRTTTAPHGGAGSFRLTVFLAALVLLPNVLPAQNAAAGSESVFAPYVSRLRVAFKDPKVQLTWQDPSDVSGPLQIYRSTQPITAATFDSATLVGTAPAGTESYLDVPARPGDYYYAVLVQKPGDGTYRIFIPFRNVTLQPIKVARTATQSELAASVSGIRASRVDRSILLVFESSRPNRTLGIYRSTSPILSSDALASATRIQEISSAKSSVTDYPVPGIDYYYAIVDTALLTTGNVSLQAGEDATSTPVSLPLGGNSIGIPTQPIPPRRGTPLPYLVLREDVQSGATLAPSLVEPTTSVALSAETAKSVNQLVDGITA